MTTRSYLTYFLLFFFAVSLFGQYEKQTQLAEQYLKENKSKWDLMEEDISDIKAYDAYQTKHNGVTHIYFNQRYKGIPIYNAVYNANLLPNGKVFFTGNRFHSNISEKVNTIHATLSPEAAVATVLKHLEVDITPVLKTREQEGKKVIFKNTNISNSDIPVELVFQPMPNGSLQLAWQLPIDMIKSADFWNVRIDAQTGDLLDKNNWTRHCSFPDHQHTGGCGYLSVQSPQEEMQPSNEQAISEVDGAKYNVFAIPLQSPLEGNRTMVNDPADPAASPLGWHDTDGVGGPNFTITRGNNVHAYADPEDSGSPSNTYPEPEGGADLVFDFEYDADYEPIDTAAGASDNMNIAVTQLYYMNNIMHDFSYHYGFTEQAGNFQQHNYTSSGRGGDYVEAEALDGALTGSEGNATFGTPPDGINPSMGMFVWNRGGTKVMKIDEPEDLAGPLEVGRTNGWDVPLDSNAVVGKSVAIALDGSGQPTLGCNAIINPEEVKGKIALIDRGECFFVEKANNAEAAGALAVIICNFEDTRIPMGAPTGIRSSIPVVMLTRGDCQTIKQNLDDLVLTLQIPPSAATGPNQLDGDLDNGIVAHEYGHGISGRLTGGPTNSDCLSNLENLGEGWSDFFALITSAKSNETGKEARGIGNYVLRDGIDGIGIRRYPYSTDISVHPQTYRNTQPGNAQSTAPHPIGEIWANVLWDLYWAMSDKYGWDENLYTGTGGNNMAIQLVMDGMKLQACSPGFVDGRDAILAADEANNGGANQCLIWEVFARRGIGYSADQGSSDLHADVIEGFDIAPSCIQTVKIDKQVTPTITAGESILVTLTVTNHKEEAVTDLTVTDILPQGVVAKSGTASATIAAQDNSQIVFTIPALVSGASTTISYELDSDPSAVSTSQFIEGGEDGNDLWLVIDDQGTSIWGLQDALAHSGDFAWYVPDVDEGSKHTLLLDEEITITGNQPALRFFHFHDIDPGVDGGLVEISTDGGTSWKDLGPNFMRNGYTGPISYSTFAIPNRDAFWGDNKDFQASYVDLSDYKGETVLIRFRYGSDEKENDPSLFQGWFIDDVEFLDLLAYQSEACVTTAEGDNACTLASDGGTIVETGALNTAVDNLEDQGLLFKIFPNPAGDYINISLSSTSKEVGTIALFNMNGQQIIQKNIQLSPLGELVPFNVSAQPSGFYFVEVRTATGVAMKKVVLE